jgi:hypothetical protein
MEHPRQCLFYCGRCICFSCCRFLNAGFRTTRGQPAADKTQTTTGCCCAVPERQPSCGSSNTVSKRNSNPLAPLDPNKNGAYHTELPSGAQEARGIANMRSAARGEETKVLQT